MAFHLSSCLLLAVALFGISAAKHQYRVRRADTAVIVQASSEKGASIVEQSSDFNPADKSFVYSYKTDNGIAAQSHGYINKEGVYAIEGSFTLFNAQGVPVPMTYVADQNGYQVFGDLVPVPDAAIARSNEYLRSLPQQKEQSAQV